MNRRLQLSALILLLVTALVFVVAPLVNYFRHPTYAWEMSLVEFTQGGIETLGLFALFVLTALLPVKRFLKVSLYLLGILAYLRLHNVDLPFLIGWLWLEGVLATGAWLCPPRLRISSAALYTLRFVSGICIWTLGALLLSALHLATVKWLFWYSALLFIVAAVGLRKKPFAFSASKYLAHPDPMVAVCSIYMLISVLALSARGAMVIEFDSIWYGLRSEWVLAPHGSIFDRLDLISWVYYYPKLFEFLTLPTRYLTDYSFLYAINIVVYFSIGVCALSIMRLCGMRLRHGMLAAVLVMSMPAMTTMSMTAKPDNFVAYLLLVGCLFFIMGLRRGRSIWLLGTLALVALALSTKLTAVPFGGLLLISAVIASWHALRGRSKLVEPGNPVVHRSLIALSIMSAVICAAFLFRTYHLTGFPLAGSKSVDQLFESMGFSAQYPTVPYLPKGSDFHHNLISMESLRIFFAYLFQPTVLPNVGWVWPGNVGFLLVSFGCLYAAFTKPVPPWLTVTLGLMPILVVGCLLAVSYSPLPGGDGNYFIFPVTLATLLGLGCLWQSGHYVRIGLRFITPVLIAAGSYVAFLLSPGLQHPGTAAFSLDFSRPPLHAAHDREAEIKENGLWPVQQFILAQMPDSCRGLATGDWDTLYKLSCTIENFSREGHERSDEQSEKELIDYLNAARINLFIVPKFPAPGDYFRTSRFLRDLGFPVIETPLYLAVDLRQAAGKIPVPPTEKFKSPVDSVELIAELSAATATDLGSPSEPRINSYQIAPNNYVFITGAPTLLVSADIALRFPVEPTPVSARSGFFTAAVGMRPEDTMADKAPLTLTARLLAADGKELATASWPITAGDYRSVRLDFSPGMEQQVRYLELRCTQAAPGEQTPAQLLISQPQITYAPQEK